MKDDCWRKNKNEAHPPSMEDNNDIIHKKGLACEFMALWNFFLHLELFFLYYDGDTHSAQTFMTVIILSAFRCKWSYREKKKLPR